MKRIALLILFLVTGLVASAQYYTSPHTPAYINNIVDSLIRPSVYKPSVAGNVAELLSNSMVNKTQSYADPSWITSLNYSKLTGTVPFWLLASGGTLTGPNEIIGTTSNTVKYRFDNLGVTASNVFMLANDQAAALGAQQISPPLTLRGRGWATSGSTSQTVDFYQYTLPVQGTSPTGTLTWAMSVNGGANATALSLNSTGSYSTLTVPGKISSTSITNPSPVNGDYWWESNTPILFYAGTAMQIVMHPVATGFAGNAIPYASAQRVLTTSANLTFTGSALSVTGTTTLTTSGTGTTALTLTSTNTASSGNTNGWIFNGSYGIQSSPGITTYQTRINNTATPSATNNILIARANTSTYTINFTGTSIIDNYFAPTIGGSQTPSHVYALQATTGKIGMAEYANPTPTNGDMWWEGSSFIVRMTGVTRRVVLTPFGGGGIGANHIVIGAGVSESFVASSANLTFNGTDFVQASGSHFLQLSSLVSGASNSAHLVIQASAGQSPALDFLSGVRLQGTGTLSSTSGQTSFNVRDARGLTTGATNQNLFSYDASGTMTVGHTGVSVYGFRYNPIIAGAQTPSHIYAFQATTGKIGLADYSNSNPTTGDIWFSAGVPATAVGNAFKYVAFAPNTGLPNTQIVYGVNSTGAVQASANFTFNGSTLSLANSSVNIGNLVNSAAPAISIVANQAYTNTKPIIQISPGGGVISIGSSISITSLLSTGAVTFSGSSAIHYAIGRANNAYSFTTGTTNIIYGTHFSMSKSGGSGEPLRVVSAYHDAGYVQWASVLSPAQITSDQNDYNPTGWTNGGAPYGASIVNLSSNSNVRTLSGWTGGVDGRLAIIGLTGSNQLAILTNQSSSAANQYELPTNIFAYPNEYWLQFYDDTAQKWRITGVHWMFDSTRKGLVPASGGGTTNFLRADGTWAAPGVGSVSISTLTAAVGANPIDNLAHLQTWSWNSLTSGTGLILQTTSTGRTGSGSKVVDISSSGAHGASSISTTSLNVANQHTGTTSTNYALKIASSGATTNYGFEVVVGTNGSTNVGGVVTVNGNSTTNTGIDISVTGSSSTNRAINIAAGNLRIADASVTSVVDVNNNEFLKFSSTASAVNEFTITNAATGNAPLYSVTGGDTNIGAKFATKGSGAFTFTTNTLDWSLSGDTFTTPDQSTFSGVNDITSGNEDFYIKTLGGTANTNSLYLQSGINSSNTSGGISLITGAGSTSSGDIWILSSSSAGTKGNLVLQGQTSSNTIDFKSMEGGLIIREVEVEPTAAVTDSGASGSGTAVALYNYNDATESTLGIRVEKAVQADVIGASTHTLRVRINGTIYKLMLSN